MVHAVHINQLTGLVTRIRLLLNDHSVTPETSLELEQLLKVATALIKRWVHNCMHEGWWNYPQASASLVQQHIKYTHEVVLLIESAIARLQDQSVFELVSCSGIVVSMWPVTWPNQHFVTNPQVLTQMYRFMSWLSDALHTGVTHTFSQILIEADIHLFTSCVVRRTVYMDHSCVQNLDLAKNVSVDYFELLCHLTYTALRPTVNNFQYNHNPLLGGNRSAASIILPQLLILIQHISRGTPQVVPPAAHKVAELVIVFGGMCPVSPEIEAILEVAMGTRALPGTGEAYCTDTNMARILSRCVEKYPILQPFCIGCMANTFENDKLHPALNNMYLDLDACLLCLHASKVNMMEKQIGGDIHLQLLLKRVLDGIAVHDHPSVVHDRLRTVYNMPGMLVAWEAIIRGNFRSMNILQKSCTMLQAAALLHAHTSSTALLTGDLGRISSMSITILKMVATPNVTCKVRSDNDLQLVTDQVSETLLHLLDVFDHISNACMLAQHPMMPEGILDLESACKTRICLVLCMEKVHSCIPAAALGLVLAVKAAATRVPTPSDGMQWLEQDLPAMNGRVLPGCCSHQCTNMYGPCETALKTQLCPCCRRARYCTKKCQKSDWLVGQHGLVCGKGRWAIQPSAAEVARQSLKAAYDEACAAEALASAAMTVMVAEVELLEADATSYLFEVQAAIEEAAEAGIQAESATAIAEASLAVSAAAAAAAHKDAVTAALKVMAYKGARDRADAAAAAAAGSKGNMHATRMAAESGMADAIMAVAAAKERTTAAVAAAKAAGVM